MAKIDFDKKIQQIDEALRKQFPELTIKQTPGLPLGDFSQIITEHQNGNLIIISDFSQANEFLRHTPFINVHWNLNAMTALPFWVALITTIFGLFNGNYYLILSFIAVFFGLFLSSPAIGRSLFVFMLLMGIIACYYAITAQSSTGVLLLFLVGSWFCATIARKYLHRKILELALANERILCMLFANHAIHIIWNNKFYRFENETLEKKTEVS